MSALSMLRASLSVSFVHLEAVAVDLGAWLSSHLTTTNTASTDAITNNTDSSRMNGGGRSVRLVVGLGNYTMSSGMRHSVGFQVLDRMAERHRAPWSANRKLKSMVAEVGADPKDFGNTKPKVILIKPKLFMNESGDAVARAIKHYSASLTHIIIVHDDLERELGKISIKESGSAAGHNGVRSIISLTRSQAFPRVRVGIGRGGSNSKVRNFVLQDFDSDEVFQLHHGSSNNNNNDGSSGAGVGGGGVLDAACDAVDNWIKREPGTSPPKPPRQPRVKRTKAAAAAAPTEPVVPE